MVAEAREKGGEGRLPVNLMEMPGVTQVSFANLTRISYHETDFTIAFAVIDTNAIAEASRKAKEGKAEEGPSALDAMVTQKVNMSVSTFLRLRKQVEEMYESYKKSPYASVLSVERA